MNEQNSIIKESTANNIEPADKEFNLELTMKLLRAVQQHLTKPPYNYIPTKNITPLSVHEQYPTEFYHYIIGKRHDPKHEDSIYTFGKDKTLFADAYVDAETNKLNDVGFHNIIIILPHPFPVVAGPATNGRIFRKNTYTIHTFQRHYNQSYETEVNNFIRDIDIIIPVDGQEENASVFSNAVKSTLKHGTERFPDEVAESFKVRDDLNIYNYFLSLPGSKMARYAKTLEYMTFRYKDARIYDYIVAYKKALSSDDLTVDDLGDLL